MNELDRVHALLQGLGWPLVRVHTGKNKYPITREGDKAYWRNPATRVKLERATLKRARRADGHILGVLFPPDVVVLDFDHKKALPRFNHAVGGPGYDLRSGTLAVQSGRGYHLYYTLPKKADAIRGYKKKHKLFADIDVRFNGMMVVPPSLHWKKKHHYHFIDNGHAKPAPMPKELRRLFKRVAAEVGEKHHGGEASINIAEPPDGEPYITEDQLRTALDALPVSQYRDRISYLRILSSIHHGTRGAQWALDLLLEWSELDPEYGSAEHQKENIKMWNSL